MAKVFDTGKAAIKKERKKERKTNNKQTIKPLFWRLD